MVYQRMAQQVLSGKLYRNVYPDDEIIIGGAEILDFGQILADSSRSNAKTYNYVIMPDGELRFGKMYDEIGGGHIDLARGKPVLAAGEIKLGGKSSRS